MLRETYEAVAPDSDHWPQLVHKVFELAATFEGWTPAQLHGIDALVLVMAGDQDVVTIDHAHWLSRQCLKGQLCILPRTDHLAPVSRHSWVSAILSNFLAEDVETPMQMQAAHE